MNKYIAYLWSDRDKSVFFNNFIERFLKVPATTRNLTTIKKISVFLYNGVWRFKHLEKNGSGHENQTGDQAAIS
jgi:hypothetical protein